LKRGEEDNECNGTPVAAGELHEECREDRRMKRLVALPLLLVVALAGCSKPKPVVVLDSWWNASNAKKICDTSKQWMQVSQGLIAQKGCAEVKSCPEMTVRSNACATSPTGGLEDFEAKLSAQLAACSGIKFMQFRDPNQQREATADAAQQWQLMIQFEPGAASQAWTLSGPSSEYARAVGAPEDVATQVCRIVGSRRG
jgi:hypothetical protein